MSATNKVSVERFPNDSRSCTHGPAEEVGWFGWIYERTVSSEHHGRRSYIPDPERQFLRKLSAQWSTVQNLDLDSASSSDGYEEAFAVEEWHPLFHMRSWIQKNREQFDNYEPNIVSAGRTLRLLLDAPNYVNDRDRKTVQYVACKRQGTIYLTCSRVQDNQPETAESARLETFQKLLTPEGDSRKLELRTSKSTHFFSVLGRTFDNIKVLYTQKIDCIDPMIAANPPANYVTLMLDKRNQSTPRGELYCHWREQNPCRAAWAKTFLTGCPQAIVGHQTGSILQRCEKMRNEDIPDKTDCSKPRCNSHWDKKRNISFLTEFLEIVQDKVIENYDCAVYGFEIDFSGTDQLIIRITEWTAGTPSFDENNILRTWGGADIWNNPEQQNPQQSPNKQ